MDRALAEEARAVLAAARAWLEELSEEGVAQLAPMAGEGRPTLAADPAPQHAATTSPHPAAVRPPAPPSARRAPREEPPAPTPASRRDEPLVATPASRREELLVPTPAPPWGERPSLEAVRDELGDCRRCRLCEGRTQIVFGDGDPEADILFVGEGPGEQEDRQGLPFVGRAGELLTAMIEKGLGIPRSSVYICNIVKCRPPNNRTPLPDEVAACRPFLDGQIAAVAPKVIVSLGKPAASLLLGRDVAITRVRGTWQEYRGIPLMPTLHPAFLLRQYTVENRRLVWEDLKSALARSREGRDRA